MQIRPTAIEEVKLLEPRRFSDARGVFVETYRRQTLASLGIDMEFIQDNESISTEKGTVRGLHYQLPPFAQAKLIRVSRGAIMDVVLDIRRSSPTFGKSACVDLNAENWNQLFIPVGFAHGFVTLEPDTHVMYKVSAVYSPAHERGILWNDPALSIDWKIGAEFAKLSEKDRKYPVFSAVTDLF